jgi:S-adenosylmethionine:tRNA ribosyltransferase-isomerase
MHPKYLKIKDFAYQLPDEKIAIFPLPDRDSSKLLIYTNGNIEESRYKQLAQYLPGNSLLVFNNTKVVEARIIFQKPSGSTIEIFCLEPANEVNEISSAMLRKKDSRWKCLVGGAKKWKEPLLTKEIKTNNESLILSAKIAEKKNDYFLIDFSWNEDISFAEVLHLAGIIPLPPYLNRETVEEDKQTYQTIYAKHDGSVAAPTAGLHFTEFLFQKLQQKNIHSEFVTLHVGAGTFKPVKSELIKDHEMHAEFIDVSVSLVKKLLNNLNNIVAVGTTSLRTIESLYWMGVKLNRELTKGSRNITIEEISVHQWDPYEINTNLTAQQSLQILLEWMNENRMERIITKTQIMIAPGYSLRIADGLITNFHQPQSTLLLLIAAIVGDDWKVIYNYALENNFRFLSYGDGCFLRNKH